MRGDDTAARAIEKLPDDAIAPGFDLLISGDDAKDTQEKIEQRWKDLGAVGTIRAALHYERAYGGGAIIIGADDGQDLRTPLNLDGVRSVDYLTVLEPRECTPLWYYSNPLAPNFRKPSIFQVSPISRGVEQDGQWGAEPFEIHESRLISFGGRVVNADSTTDGWGDSALTLMYRVLRDFNGVWDAAATLTQDFSQSVFKIQGLAQILANDDDQAFRRRLQALDLSRSIVRAMVIDGEEEFERKATPLTGLPDLLDRFESRVAAAVGMPVTVLFGRSPAGLNATGESDLQIWYDTLGTYRDHKPIPALEKLTAALLAEAGSTPDRWSIQGRPIKEASDKEIAETRQIHAETAKVLIEAGVLYPEEVAQSLFGGDAYSPEIVVDWKEREKLELEADQAQAEADALEMERLKTQEGEDPRDESPPAPGDNVSAEGEPTEGEEQDEEDEDA
jgi:phage-related protein (TIGR01555 family)